MTGLSRKDHIDLLGASVLIAVSASNGLNQALIKFVNAGLAPVFQAGLRSLLAIIPVLLFAWWMRKSLTLRDGSLIPGILAGLCFAFEFLLLYNALDFTTVSRASIFFYTMPIWAAIGAHFFIPGDRLTPTRILGLAIAFLGVVLALAHNAEPASDRAFLGDVLCLVAAVFWAAILFLARTTRLSRACPEMQLLYQLVVSAIVLLALAPLFGEAIREFTPLIGGVLAIQVFGVVGIGFLAWFWVLSVYPASSMASFGFLSPVFGVLFGWIIFDESLSGLTLVSLAMVGCGIVLVSRKPRSVEVSS